MQFFAHVLPTSPFATGATLEVDAVIAFVQGDDPTAKAPTRLLNDAYDLGNGKSAYFSIGSLDLNVVPEPSTYAMLAMAGVGFAGYVVRRRRR